MGKFIRNLYFIELPEEKKINMFGSQMIKTNLKQIKFNWRDKLSHIKKIFYQLFCRKKKEEPQDLGNEGGFD